MNRNYNSMKKKLHSSYDGVILISMSIGIFLIISIFTFFLLKLVVKEHNMSLLHTLDVKTRNLSHSALGRGIFQFSDFRNITSQTGELNNGEYEISYNGVNDENNLPLPYSHYTMLESKAEINDSDRKTRVFLSSFPSGFNPAFYGENLNNSHFNFGNNINGGQLIKKDGGLHYNGSPISSEGIVESMPNFNNMYGDEIIWTQNNVQPNQSNQGNSNNKFLNFDGNDYAKIPYTFNETITTPGSYVNTTIDFEAGISIGSGNWGYIPSGYMGYNWHNRIYAARGNWYGTGNGYYKGLSSGSNIIYNAWNEQNVYFESSDGHLFNFLNIHGAGAWCGNNVLTIKGYNNGNLVATKSYTLTNTQGRWYSWYNSPIYNVNKIVFTNSCWHWSLDDIIVQRQLPPTTQTSINSTLPKYNEPRTITAWVKPSDDHNTGGGIITTGTGDCTGKMFGIGRSSGKLFFWGGCKDWSTNLSVPKNEWSFIAIKYDGVYLHAYVNDQHQQTTLNNFNTQPSEFFIGGETTNNGVSFRNYFRGRIDEVAIWNEALSHSEITALYNEGVGLNAATNSGNYSSSANLKGYWKFDAGNGNTLYDESNNNKNGYITGASWNTGSHTQPQIGPLVFNAGTQLNLNSPSCGSNHTSLCINNKIAVNQDIIFKNTNITGSGLIISSGEISLTENTTISGDITIIANKIEINNSSLGNNTLFNGSNGAIIIYIENGGIILNSNNVAGLIINHDLNNSDDLIINNSNVYGAILNYCSNFELNNNSTVIGSVVSNYLVNIDNSSTITKGNLPSFYGKNIGLSTSIVPGSYLEY